MGETVTIVVLALALVLFIVGAVLQRRERDRQLDTWDWQRPDEDGKS